MENSKASLDISFIGLTVSQAYNVTENLHRSFMIDFTETFTVKIDVGNFRYTDFHKCLCPLSYFINDKHAVFSF